MLLDRVRQLDERLELLGRRRVLTEPVLTESEQLAHRARVGVGVAQRSEQAGRVALTSGRERLRGTRRARSGRGAAPRPAIRASSSPASVLRSLPAPGRRGTSRLGRAPGRPRRRFGRGPADLAQRRPGGGRRRHRPLRSCAGTSGSGSRHCCASGCGRRCSAEVRFADRRPLDHRRACAPPARVVRRCGPSRRISRPEPPSPRPSRFGPHRRRAAARGAACRHCAADRLAAPPADSRPRSGRADPTAALRASSSRAVALDVPVAGPRRTSRFGAPSRRGSRFGRTAAGRRTPLGVPSGAAAARAVAGAGRRAWARRSGGAACVRSQWDSLPWGDVQRTRRRPP